MAHDTRKSARMRYATLRTANKCVVCTEPTVNGTSMCAKHLDYGNTYNRAKYKRLKSSNICTGCGKVKPRPNKNTCSKCAFTRNEAVKRCNAKRMAARVLDGTCSKCDRPLVSGKELCSVHLAERNAKSRAERQRRKDAGMCVRCRKAAPRPNRATCSECAAKIRESDRLNREMLIGKGICVTCCKAASRPNRTTCSECAAKKREKSRLNREMLIGKGICVTCCKVPAKIGAVRCDECLKRHNAYTAKHRAAKKQRTSGGGHV